MIDYTEEYFEIEKDKLYSKIMDRVEELVGIPLDIKFAYKTYIYEVCYSELSDELITFHLFENILISEYEKHCLLNSINPFTSFLLSIKDSGRVKKLIEKEIQLHAFSHVHMMLNGVRTCLLEMESELEYHSDKVISFISKAFLNKGQLEKKALEIVRDFYEKLNNLSYVSSLIIQHRTLSKVINETEIKYKIDSINLGRYTYDDFYLQSELSWLPIKFDDWRRVEEKIIKLGLIEVSDKYDTLKKIVPNDQVSENYKVPNITPIEWLGSCNQLESLLVTLENKGWIKILDENGDIIDNCKNTLQKCFSNSSSLFEKENRELITDWDKILDCPTDRNLRLYKASKKSPLIRIKWNGSNLDLANLFIELYEHKWIKLYKLGKRVLFEKGYIDTIMSCFTKSNGIKKDLGPGAEYNKFNGKTELTYTKARVDYKPSELFCEMPNNNSKYL